MKLVFLDKITGEPASPGYESEGLYLGQDAKVYDYIVQNYASFSAMIHRDDVKWGVIYDDTI